MSKHVTLKDIAREANLSIPAVSKALAGHPTISRATRLRVRELSDQLNYVSTRRTSSKEGKQAGQKHRRIRLMLVNVGRIASDASHWLLKLTQAQARYPVSLELGGINTDQDAEWETSMQQQVQGMDALLLFGYIEPAVLAAVVRCNIPTICSGGIARIPGYGEPHPAGIYRIGMDALDMSCTATEYLIRKGHERIGFFCAPYRPGSWNDLWLSGYRLACMRAGIKDQEELHPILKVDNLRHIGKAAVRHFTSLKKPPTAYVVPNVLGGVRFHENMQEVGISLDRNQLVVGGMLDESIGSPLENYPIIHQEMTGMATHVLDLLMRLTAGETPHAFEMIVPYSLSHFD